VQRRCTSHNLRRHSERSAQARPLRLRDGNPDDVAAVDAVLRLRRLLCGRRGRHDDLVLSLSDSATVVAREHAHGRPSKPACVFGNSCLDVVQRGSFEKKGGVFRSRTERGLGGERGVLTDAAAEPTTASRRYRPKDTALLERPHARDRTWVRPPSARLSGRGPPPAPVGRASGRGRGIGRRSPRRGGRGEGARRPVTRAAGGSGPWTART